MESGFESFKRWKLRSDYFSFVVLSVGMEYVVELLTYIGDEIKLFFIIRNQTFWSNKDDVINWKWILKNQNTLLGSVVQITVNHETTWLAVSSHKLGQPSRSQNYFQGCFFCFPSKTWKPENRTQLTMTDVSAGWRNEVQMKYSHLLSFSTKVSSQWNLHITLLKSEAIAIS